MNKLLIAFGSIILFVTLPCASKSRKSAYEVDDVNEYDDNYQRLIIDDDFQENIIDNDDFQKIIDDDDFQQIIDDDDSQQIIVDDDFQENITDDDDSQQIIVDDDFQENITDEDDNGDRASNEDICDDVSYTTKKKFVESDGIKKTCTTHSDCYDQREPPSWCSLNENQTWGEHGCYCSSEENACVIERKNRGELEYTYCAPAKCWKCA